LLFQGRSAQQCAEYASQWQAARAVRDHLQASGLSAVREPPKALIGVSTISSTRARSM